MAAYRKAIKEHFEGIPVWNKLLRLDFLFWGLGLALCVLGGGLAWVAASLASVLNSLGSWMTLFGLVLAFIKKTDRGLMFTTAGLALFQLELFILVAKEARAFEFGALLGMCCYGVLCFMAWRVSGDRERMRQRRAEKAAVRAQLAGEAICVSCGAALPAGAMFCNACGAKRPERKKCASCGNLLAESVQFCDKCGAQATGTQAVSADEAADAQGASPQAANTSPSVPSFPGYTQSAKKKLKGWQLALVIGVPIVVFLTIAYFIGTGDGGADKGYYAIGGERVPSVAYALGEERKVKSTTSDEKDGVETLIVSYRVAGGEQGADMLAYLEYLQRKDGFSMRTQAASSVFQQQSGSTIQAWRNAADPGYMLVVQTDWDDKGYTITLMRGEGSMTPAATETPTEVPVDVPGTTPTEEQPPAGGDSGEYAHLLPAGEPSSTNTLNGLRVARYADSTISVNDGAAIIRPDGAVYILGELANNLGVIDMPEGGTRISLGSGASEARLISGETYLIANGTVLYIDADGSAYAYTAGDGSGTGSTETAASLLPMGEPTGTQTFGGWDIATYAGGTVVVGQNVVIQPDGTIYVGDVRLNNLGDYEIPEGDTYSSIEIQGGFAVMVDGELFVAVNGSILYVDSENDAYAYSIAD